MIRTKQDLHYYLECDRIAMSKKGKAKPWDITYWFLYCLRHYEYWHNQSGIMKKIMSPLWHLRFKRISEKCGFTIPINIIGPGLCVPHIGPGAKIIGEGIIADNVVIGANAVVTGSIEEAGITVGGIPAKKISDKDSYNHLVKATEIYRNRVEDNVKGR